MRPELELETHRLLHRLAVRHQDVRRAVWVHLREARRLFAAARACFAVAGAEAGARVRTELPRGGAWDLDLLAAFLRDQRTEPPDDLLVAPVHRRGRLWGVLALHSEGVAFERGAGRALSRITGSLSAAIAEVDRERAAEVRERIDRKIMELLRPKDVFYQILHGLRSLIRYDHSSALWTATADGLGTFELAAEQIAWSKAKSQRVGQRRALDLVQRQALLQRPTHGFDAGASGWWEWSPASRGLAPLLADGQPADAPPPGSALTAPLATRDGLLGVLEVAARHPGGLTDHEAELVRRFVPQAAIAIRYSLKTETLERDVLMAERRHAMVNIARGISHDVNNALGSVLPTVQQIKAEAADGSLDAAQLRTDLDAIESGLRTCRRIFRGLLSFARSETRTVGEGSLPRALDNVLALLRDGLQRRGVAIDLQVPASLPAVRGVQHELEQVLLNITGNARDAMPNGGRLRITAREAGRWLEVEVGDDGTGMTPAQLRRSDEPFFTTKPHGNGLGLSICRSILADMRGRMEVTSAPGRGTVVRLLLPRSADRADDRPAADAADADTDQPGDRDA